MTDYLFLVSLYAALRDFLCFLMHMSQVTPKGMKFNVFHFFFNFVHEIILYCYQKVRSPRLFKQAQLLM
jgi:hypothetical protein